MEKYSLGNIINSSIESIYKNLQEVDFIKESIIVPKDCQECKYFTLCRNGCKRYRVNGKYYYCHATYRFYDNFLPKLKKIAKKLITN